MAACTEASERLLCFAEALARTFSRGHLPLVNKSSLNFDFAEAVANLAVQFSSPRVGRLPWFPGCLKAASRRRSSKGSVPAVFKRGNLKGGERLGL